MMWFGVLAGCFLSDLFNQSFLPEESTTPLEAIPSSPY
jgi:hypothetical protein